MLKHSSHQPYLSAAILLCALVASPFASAGCGCPDDGHGAPTPPPPKTTGSTGLGQAFPTTPDLAADPAWQVYEFERDGIRYVQVNDKAGVVRAAVGRIDGTFWVMPIGDADRVTVTAPVPAAGGRPLYRSNEVEVVLYRRNNRDLFLIRQPGSAQ